MTALSTRTRCAALSAVDAPLVPHWVAAAVMSADAAERVEHDRKRQEEIAGLRSDLDQLLAVATLYLESFSGDDRMSLPERLGLREVEEVVARRGKRY